METEDELDAVLEIVPDGGSAAIRQVTFEPYGRFLLLDRIGQGGMADIYRAVAQRAEGFRRTFVVKRIRPEKSTSQEFIRMFCEEARISAMLNHPNIVQVYDFGSIGGSYFLAMEYLPGRDLSSTMRRLRARGSAMDASLASFIASQVAHGLDHAHKQCDASGELIGVVHRDVTPSNVMLLSEGGVKILDFGIALGGYSPHREKTREGMVRGKLSYLSPEQVRCEKLDGRADVFALGIVLWEMLTGARLFAGTSEFETMRNVLEMPVPLPSSLKPTVPTVLDHIVSRALNRDLQKRYQTAAEMAADLESFLEAAPFSSRAVPKLLIDLFGAAGDDPLPEPPEGTFPAGELLSSSLPSALASSAGASVGSLPRTGPGAPLEAEAAPRRTPRAARITFPVLAAAAQRSVRPLRTTAAVSVACALIATLSLGWRARHRPSTSAQVSAALEQTWATPAAAPKGIQDHTETTPVSVHEVTLPPARRDVRLLITSSPAGATVQTTDGHVLGHTPLSLPWPAGEAPIKLTLDKDGYLPRELMPVPSHDQKVKVALVADR